MPVVPVADWILFWSYLRGVPASSGEAGREHKDALGSHRQVSLITIGRAGRGGSKRLLTPMIQVCFPLPHLKPAQEDLLSWQWFRRRCHLKVTDRDFVDRWSLDLIKTICGFLPGTTSRANHPQSAMLLTTDSWLNRSSLAA